MENVQSHMTHDLFTYVLDSNDIQPFMHNQLGLVSHWTINEI